MKESNYFIVHTVTLNEYVIWLKDFHITKNVLKMFFITFPINDIKYY